MNRLLSVLFWSVIAAAFIGPGTVTAASSSGAAHGTALLWALGFSTIACLVLQEAAGRLRLLSGRSLGEALVEQFPSGFGRVAVVLLVGGAILLGSAAYEAGNILGGVAGAMLLTDIPRWVLTLVSGAIAGALLWFNAPRRVAQVLGMVVAVMGIAFLGMAIASRPAMGDVLRGLFVPSLPPGSGLLALSLVGTTVVPYNLFLGSGIRREEDLSVFRFGLAVAIVLGGLISMGILLVGMQVAPPMTFERLANTLAEGLGDWAGSLFGVGLLCAGLSSAITAPLAAAITARSLFRSTGNPEDQRWSDRGVLYRAVWLSVLGAGLFFGLSGVRPVPAILLAQALNGVILPVIAVYLLVAVNDRELMGQEGLNGSFSNLMFTLVGTVTLILGTSGVMRAAAAVAGGAPPSPVQVLTGAGVVAALLIGPLLRTIGKRRRGVQGQR